MRRQLMIRSEPPGAQVLLNDEHIGTTPLSYDFEWYGWHRITLTKDGYERLEDHVNITSPAHLWIPMDFIMELLPMTVRDDRAFSYHLVPLTPIPEPAPPTPSTTEEKW